MKIGILTLPLHTNYGGILQAYALQTVLERMGHNVVVFDTDKRLEIPKSPLIYAKRLIAKMLKKDSIPIFYELNRNKSYPFISCRTQLFIDKYIKSCVVDNLQIIKKNDFEAIVVGSDQIWRPIYFCFPFKAKVEDAFLNFTKGWNIKRISYAASFGVEHWEYPEYETAVCREAISKFDAVSVREDIAVKQCQDFLGVNAQHVLDPTMLLDKEDYISLIFKEKEPKSKGSLFEYILDMNPEKKNIIDAVARKTKLQPFAVKPSDKGRLEERVYPHVTSWLRAFMDAKFVVCDSFHGAVFSIIFNKPFIVIGNEKRGMARFSSLLKMFSLEDRLISNINEIAVCEKAIDWERVNNTREQFKKRSKGFLSIHLS